MADVTRACARLPHAPSLSHQPITWALTGLAGAGRPAADRPRLVAGRLRRPTRTTRLGLQQRRELQHRRGHADRPRHAAARRRDAQRGRHLGPRHRHGGLRDLAGRREHLDDRLHATTSRPTAAVEHDERRRRPARRPRGRHRQGRLHPDRHGHQPPRRQHRADRDHHRSGLAAHRHRRRSRASASDGGSGVATTTVQYRPSGGGSWTDICTQASATATCSWNTAALADGLYDLRTVSDRRGGQRRHPSRDRLQPPPRQHRADGDDDRPRREPDRLGDAAVDERRRRERHRRRLGPLRVQAQLRLDLAHGVHERDARRSRARSTPRTADRRPLRLPRGRDRRRQQDRHVGRRDLAPDRQHRSDRDDGRAGRATCPARCR